jgi:hypothetical protein
LAVEDFQQLKFWEILYTYNLRKFAFGGNDAGVSGAAIHPNPIDIRTAIY